ncbi:CHAT domain-containing protein [Streptomyces syringium]|uniref:CHAT domain-containing protein n=1 Tax=Streptomyces syringium TaxID=76729 RepID=UPI0036544697
MSSAFLVIGAAGVVASQWQVPDDATNLLMAAFYDYWEEGGEPSEALHRAQLWLRDATNQELQQRFPDTVGSGPSGTAPRLLWVGTGPMRTRTSGLASPTRNAERGQFPAAHPSPPKHGSCHIDGSCHIGRLVVTGVVK